MEAPCLSLSDWISAIGAAANVTVAISVIYVARQAISAAAAVREAQIGRAEDHRRSRHQSAIELLHKWNDNVTMPQTCAMFVVNSLDPRNARSFMRCKAVRVPATQARNIVVAMRGVAGFQLPAALDGFIRLDEAAVLHVGNECMQYIDLLEVILIGWRYETAEPVIIEEQFSALVKPEEGQLIARNFRVALGIEKYPNIEMFVEEIVKLKSGHSTRPPT